MTPNEPLLKKLEELKLRLRPRTHFVEALINECISLCKSAAPSEGMNEDEIDLQCREQAERMYPDTQINDYNGPGSYDWWKRDCERQALSRDVCFRTLREERLKSSDAARSRPSPKEQEPTRGESGRIKAQMDELDHATRNGHCSGCTDPRSEGTHQMGTIEHPDFNTDPK